MKPPTVEGLKPEEIKEISGWPYWVTIDGRVFNSKGKQLTTFQKDTKPGRDHLYVQLWKNGRHKNFRIHTLVLTTFVGPKPQGLQCRHLDGKTHHNHVSNLKWGTPKENTEDMMRHGTLSKTRTKTPKCKFGHEFTPENTWMRSHTTSNGTVKTYRQCLICYNTPAEKKHELVEAMGVDHNGFRLQPKYPEKIDDPRIRLKLKALQQLEAQKKELLALAEIAEIDAQLAQLERN